jgi:hypothetical protein
VTETADGIPRGEHKGTVKEGGLTLSPQGEMIFVGVLSGKLLASMQPVEGWRELQDSKTNCSILAIEGEQALIDGELEYRGGEPLFLVPGSTIKNATTSAEAVAIPRLNGGPPFGLAHGETIRITPTGGIERVE